VDDRTAFVSDVMPLEKSFGDADIIIHLKKDIGTSLVSNVMLREQSLCGEPNYVLFVLLFRIAKEILYCLDMS
jgi:hypothetical protein